MTQDDLFPFEVSFRITNDGTFKVITGEKQEGESAQEYKRRMENLILRAALRIQFNRLSVYP